MKAFLLLNPILTAIFVVFALDLLSTIYAISKWPTRVREVNPVAKWLIDKLGLVPGMVLLKIAVLALVVGFYPMLYTWVLGLILLAHVLAALNNYKIIQALRIRYPIVN